MRILLGLVGLGLFYFFFIRTVPAPNSSMSAVAQAPDAPAKTPYKEKFDFLPPPSTSTEPPQDLQKMRVSALKNRLYEIESIKLESDNGETKIPLKFLAEKRWCEGGDLDTFDYLIADKKSNEILITIETLTSTQRGDRFKTSLENLYRGFDKTFKLSLRNNPESLGLFICRDSEGKGRCRGKEVISHGELSRLLADPDTKTLTKTKDYILYFQNFVVRDGKLIAFNNNDISKEGTRGLRTHLEEAFGVKTADFDAAWKINTMLRSVPAKIEAKQITLKLPYNDPRCLPGNREPAPAPE